MVNSRDGSGMTTDLQGLPERVERVELKVDALTARIDAIDASLERRFDAVDQSFTEHRQYTEFAFERLRTEMNDRFGRLDRKVDWIIDHLSGRKP
jgi:hypothetical protein